MEAMNGGIRGGLVALCACAALAVACGPRVAPAGPAPAEGAGDGGGAEVAAQCERLFADAVVARTDRALAQLDPDALRAAVLAAVAARAPADGRAAADTGALARAVLDHPAVREQLEQAIEQSSGDAGVLLSIGSALINGEDPQQRLAAAAERAPAALLGAFREAGLARTVLALPEVRALLAALLPAEPFAAGVAEARSGLSATSAIADARRALVVPGDVAATRVATAEWAARPAGVGCQPLVRSFPLGEALADLPSAARALDQLADALLPAPAVREETVTLVRELMGDANFRLALDALFVALLRGDDDAEVAIAARAVVASPALPQAIAAWASRLLARRAELPDPTTALDALAADPDLAAVLLRFLDVLVTTEGCVEV